MVEKLFHHQVPTAQSTVLDPGSGHGAFVEGVLRWCARAAAETPRIVAVENDPAHVAVLRQRFGQHPCVEVREADFLAADLGEFDFVVGNPPYVPITGLDVEERVLFREKYTTAAHRFDLYILFFEEALRRLRPGGRLVFVTPEKFLYVGSAAPLRRLLASVAVEELHFLDEQTFGELVTYPLITSIDKAAARQAARVLHRDGSQTAAVLDPRGASWLPAIAGVEGPAAATTLADVSVRISCGVATGADSVYLVRTAAMPPALRPFAYPTLAGREIVPGRPIRSAFSLLVPYGSDGRLLPEPALGALGDYLTDPGRRERLMARTCTRRKPWYAFHETPPLPTLLRPKILCKDIGAGPYFVADEAGTIVPRHSVYYIVPASEAAIGPLTAYLNSPAAQRWLRANCQRAANGFIRLQSHVLKRLPVPAALAGGRDPGTRAAEPA